MKTDHSALHKTHSAIINGPGTKADKARALFGAGVTKKAHISELLDGYSVGAIANALAVEGGSLNPRRGDAITAGVASVSKKTAKPPKMSLMAVRMAGVSCDDFSRKKNGNFVIRKGYFYRGNQSENKMADNLTAKIPGVRIVDMGDHYADFNGGDSVRKGSHFWVEFQLT